MSEYLVGKVIGNRYEIIEKIGTGGMATVYKAKCNVLNRFVAIKVLKDSLKDDAEVVKKFSTESRAAAGLSHPNIVQVYDVGKDDDFDYIVMEYVDGMTLKEYIKTKGKLDYIEAAKFAVQIGRALECAHKNHIVHRDIKPHNVLMAKDGRLKVADFGIAQAASGETMVAGNSGMGSVHYISPEQARGGYTNERSDVYSLGVVLYEMLTGKLPFDNVNPVSIAIMKLEQEPTDCRNIDPNIPDNIADITMKAIAKDQHSRYQSAEAMIYDLENVLGIRHETSGGYEEKYETKRLSDNEAREEYKMRKTAKHRKKKNQSRVMLGAIVIAVAVCLAFLTYCSMSGGAKEIEVPDVVNLTLEEAQAKLEEAGLKIDEEIEMEASEDVEEGLVIKQEPDAKEYVKKNRKIKLYVSSGKEDGEIEVPYVENRKIEDARKILTEEGLTYKEVEEYNENVPVGSVISQSPKEGTKVTEGFLITLTVSADVEDPNQQAVVPKVTGMNETQARRLIEEAGLVVGNVETRESQSEAGTVIEQLPSAKTGVEKGSKVNIVVSKGAAVVTPPPLKRKTLTITIPENAPETVNIRAVANGKEIYNKTHQKSQHTIDIPVQSSKDASVQVYIDGVMVADKVISFD